MMALNLMALLRSRRGSSLIEFALALPVLLGVLFGILLYGQYFLLAHSVQALANDAVRATLGGLNATERRTIAAASVATELTTLPELTATRVTTTTTEGAGFVTVSVRYDASNTAIFRAKLLPMPDPVIERKAVVRTGGIT